MLSLEMLPAGHGDCLWIEYGENDDIHRLLIDGGTKGTVKDIRKRIKALDEENCRFELMIVTHIDADHIAGVLELLEEPTFHNTFGDIWFNAYKHLFPPNTEIQGAYQAELLSNVLVQSDLPWNKKFHQKRVVVPETGELLTVDLAGDLKLTLLSPEPDQLYALQKKWKDEIEKAGLVPGHVAEKPEEEPLPEHLERFGMELPKVTELAEAEFTPDSSIANSSSISVLLEYKGSRLLLCADAHEEVLLKSIARLPGLGDDGSRLTLDAIKLPHHGSQNNVSIDLLKKLDCSRYLFSTNGSYFHHPDWEAASRVILHGGARPELYFNYRSKYNEIWEKLELTMQYGYTAIYPEQGKEGIKITFETDE